MRSDMVDITKRMRADIVEMLAAAGSGHPGGSLSACDIIAVLYFDKMNIDPKNVEDPDRDRFVLAKGHAAPALYAALAEKGFFAREDLKTLRKSYSHLQGHPNMNTTPGVEMSTGSLGQGLSVANGMALAGRLDNRDYYVYCLMGDGEIEEGQVWEAAMSASHYGLDHVIAFVDHNHLQIDGNNDQVMTVNPIDEKFRAFIIAETVKGKGVSFMENQVGWHGVAPTAEQAKQAVAEILG